MDSSHQDCEAKGSLDDLRFTLQDRLPFGTASLSFLSRIEIEAAWLGAESV
jgi:hypothetical protein